jgi:poly-gamma-glutamate system protein
VIGVLASPTTTNAGHLPAKQTSINPNFAGLMVHYLKRLNIREGDVVAVAFSGSFPALNISTMAALETLKVKPIIICSVGASQWGANIPQYLWPDMERTLNEANVFKIKSAAASLGGVDDQALGLTAEGKKILKDSIIKNGIDFLEINSFQDSIDKRMDIYREKAAEKTIKAYINVGGGIISVGSETGKRIYKPGLNRRLPPGAKNIDSVMTRFSLDGVPVIHLSKIEEIAEKYEFPLQPEKMPACGDGKIFFKKVHNKWLAAAALTLILGMLYALLRLDWGFRLLPQNGMKTGNGHPEEMV